jgi:ubiquinone/menaquinone biosynthesis C-methylase UbiE
VLSRYLARQFAHPSGLLGRYWIGPWLDRIAAPMNRLGLHMLQPRDGETVLETGFGGGALLRSLAAAGAEAWGVDPSSAMVRRARARGLRAVQGAAADLPFEAARFDRAVSVNSLYFWPDPKGAFAELARVVKPGGRLVICFEPAAELRKWPGHRFGFRLYEAREVLAMMEVAGFGTLEEAWGTGRKPDRFCCLSGTRGGANG